MSIEKITSKIIGDAENSAKVVLDEAKAKADEIIAKANLQAEEMIAKAEKEGLEEKEKLISRRKAVGDIDGRKLILEAKQELISQCFEAAVDKLTSMETDAYVAFLADLVAKTGETEGVLILNEKDKAEAGEALIKRIGEILPGSKITLAEETRNIRGGFLLKKGSVYMNGTIEALVDEGREELVGEAAGVLFQ